MSESKKVQSKKDSGNAGATVTSGRSQSSFGNQNQGAIIVDLLLFGTSGAIKKGGAGGLSMTQSFNNTISSNLGSVNQVMPLRYILKHCPLTKFEIKPDVKPAEGSSSSMSVQEGTQPQKKKHTVELKKTSASNAAKIQFLLDQRKPPTEKLPSLCAQYDDDLDRILDSDI